MNTANPDTARELMARALKCAENSPAVGRNPRVGCVLTNTQGDILATGYHHGAGHPHAEVEALRDATHRGVDPRGLTAVVTLEPCNHEGLTGPCAQALIDAGIETVIFGATDPGRESAGGAATLRHAGLTVVGGVLADESEQLNTHWFFAMRNQRPFVTAKWGQSLDGRIAAADQTSQWITSEASRRVVHEQRHRHGAILVGTNTALVDNPRLTARNPDGSPTDHQPHAVVMGRRNIPADAALRAHPGGFRHIAHHDPKRALDELFAADYRSVYLEGGATLLGAFIGQGLVDEFHITMGPLLLGGDQLCVGDIGVDTISNARQLRISTLEMVGGDVWVVAHPIRQKEG